MTRLLEPLRFRPGVSLLRALLLSVALSSGNLLAAPDSPQPAPAKTAAKEEGAVRLKNIARIVGIRSNQLVGYGVVVGLPGTGDSRSRLASESIRNLLARLGQRLPGDPDARNVAAVLVTAELPPFSGRGQRVDVTVSSIGDARSLGGGVLISTTLQAGDGRTYAVAQGVVTTGGREQGQAGASRKTVGTVLGGAHVERSPAEAFGSDRKLRVQLHSFDFATLDEVQKAVKAALPNVESRLVEGSVEVTIPQGADPFSFTARLEELMVRPKYGARVIINERTGTVVMGGDIRVDPVSISRAGMQLIVAGESRDRAGVTEELRIDYGPKSRGAEKERPVTKEFSGASVTEIVKGLNAMGADVKDIIAILEALRDSGALHARLIVI